MANPDNEVRELIANFILLFNENYLVNERHEAYEALLERFIAALKVQEIKVLPGRELPLEKGHITIHFGTDASGVYCNFSTPRDRSEPRYAELGYDFEALKLFGPVDKNIAPRPGEPYPRKDPMAVLAELLLTVGAEAKAELRR